MSDRGKWNSRYQSVGTAAPTPCRALSDYRQLLPKRGKALDLASGPGGNALFLAKTGLDTEAWDISGVALGQLEQLAQQHEVTIAATERDVVQQPPSPASFDIIVVSRFLHRPLCPAIASALRPGGLLFYQTFTQDKADPAVGTNNPDYCLKQNELLELFPGLIIRAYREEGVIGDRQAGFRNEAYLVAQMAY